MTADVASLASSLAMRVEREMRGPSATVTAADGPTGRAARRRLCEAWLEKQAIEWCRSEEYFGVMTKG
jgi:hypothetical protein